ncbi:MAG: ferritin [Thermoleophilia bacterium]|nr:ferritin [Thermoleophilia bacterium]MDH3724230.1 ferritin [Thermoleophilia bacterium]
MDDAVVDAINAQVGREFAAELEYLQISAYFDDEGLKELSSFFRAQADEERSHALRFIDYLTEAGGHVAIPALSAPRHQFESAQEAVELSLAWEESVTDYINGLMALAVQKNDFAAQQMLQWFIAEQVEEVATMSELLSVVRRAGAENLLLVEDYISRSIVNRAGPDPAA